MRAPFQPVRPYEAAKTIVDAMTKDANARKAAQKTAQEVHADVIAWLTAAAQAQTLEVLAAQDELLAGFAEAHEADVGSFDFECRRWGDFLALMVQRGGAKVMHALDIGAGAIELVAGHEPDRLGDVSFEYWVDRDGGSRGAGTNGYDGLCWPKDGAYKVGPLIPRTWVRTARINLDSRDGRWGSDDCWRTPIPFTVPTGARPAEDDVLRFAKSGAVLEVPAGNGDRVYRAILAELKRGAAA